jgi:hypothetical protein
MRILVVGAGASIEAAKRASAPEECWPPTMANFAKKMWDTPPLLFFNYWLPDYLTARGLDPGADPTSLFIRLADDPVNGVNIERLFEYCWNNRGAKFKTDWEDLVYHGILNPLDFLLLTAFHENGVGTKQLEAGKLVCSNLQDGDVVVDLNYDTLFEIAASQQGLSVTYAPASRLHGLLVAKPHGSLNLLANETSFWFAQPDCMGALPSASDDYRNYRAIVPPRSTKHTRSIRSRR